MNTSNPNDYYLPERDLGELFIDVQLAQIFKDSKTFVDCIPLHNPAAIVAAYQIEKNRTAFSLKDFVLQNFKLPSQEEAEIVTYSNDMVSHLNQHWQRLTQESNATEKYNTLISLPYPYIVPGGRFREMFYWDSYFTIIGLLVSGKDELAFGMIRNFAYLVNLYGYIPNGNRTYFLSRSQPPFFAEIIKVYGEKHGVNTVIEFFPALEKEYRFWTRNKDDVSGKNAVSGKSVWLDGAVLNRYTGDIAQPRPEAYNKEFLWAQALPEQHRPQFYLHLRAACESGWDFSSRWFADGKNKSTINCESLIPVCLNSLLYNTEIQLSQLYQYTGDNNTASHYQQLAATRKTAINKYCWSEKDGAFADYNFVLQSVNPAISLAIVYPLFFNLATLPQAEKTATLIESAFMAKGGVTTTTNYSGEQWDAPNGWAPLQWLTVIGLSRYGYCKLATTIAERWLKVNENVFLQESKMMEKYNVITPALPGGGGNYENQDGFGWTNGVALALNAWLNSSTINPG